MTKHQYISLLYIIIGIALTQCKPRKPVVSETVSSSKKETQTKELLIKGSTEKVLGNLEKAESFFQQSLKISPKVAVSYFELSEIYQYRNDAQKSISYAETAYKLAPENEWYELNLANLYLKTGQLDLAEKGFSALSKKYPTNVEYIYQLSEIYLYRRKYKEALLLYQKIEQIVGVNEELSLHKSKIYLDLNQPANATLELEVLVKSNPNEMRYLGMLADLYEQLGKSEKALELYSRILEIEPNNGYVHFSLAEHFIYRSQFDKAHEQMKKAFSSDNVELKVKAEKLEAYYINSAANQTKKTQAYELLDILIEKHSNDYRTFAYYAEFLLRDKKEIEMIEMLIKATNLNAPEFATWYHLCSSLWQTGRFEELKNTSTKAIELFPSLPTFYYFSGVALTQQKMYLEAIEILENGVEYCIDNKELKSEFYQFLADAYNAIKDFENSDMYYDQALSIDPNNVYVLNNYSYYLSLRKENLEKAKEMAEKVSKIVPNNANYIDTQAWVYFQLKDYTKAEELLSKALSLGGDSNPDILEHYGDVLYFLKKNDKALEYWLKAQKNGAKSSVLEKKIATKKYTED